MGRHSEMRERRETVAHGSGSGMGSGSALDVPEVQTTVAAWFVVSFSMPSFVIRASGSTTECTEPDECDCYNESYISSTSVNAAPKPPNPKHLSPLPKTAHHLAPTTTGLEPAISRSTTLQYRNLHKPSVHVLSEDNKRLHRHRRSVEEVAWHATVDVDHGELGSIVVLVGGV